MLLLIRPDIGYIDWSVRGDEINEVDALGIGEKAVKDVTSVVARSGSDYNVQAGEILRFWLSVFISIDRDGASQTAAEYMEWNGVTLLHYQRRHPRDL